MKCISDAVLHQDFTFEFLVPQVRPFIRDIFQSDHTGVVKNTNRTPAVRNRIFVFRVKATGFFQVNRIDLTDIWNVIVVQFCQQTIFCHFLDHVVRRTDYVVLNGTGFDDRIHFLVGLEQVISHSEYQSLLQTVQ